MQTDSGRNNPQSVTAYIGLGSSVGDRMANLREALQRLNTQAVRVLAVSPVYQSPHLGLHPGDSEKYPAHLNCAARLETTLTPEDLLSHIQAVENAGGRQRTERWGPRTIDIDILLHGDVTQSTSALALPHPGLPHRAFVLRPLADLAPTLRLPDGRAIADLLALPEIRAQILEPGPAF